MDRLTITETFAGISFPGHLHTRESLQLAQHFQFQDTDIVIATFPKSGTTWMQEILTLIHSKGDSLLAQTVPNWVRAPWLEHTYFRETVRDEGGVRLITTHLPYDILAPALKKSKAKVIYIARNPKDVAVSYYHFHKIAKFLPDPGTFEEFLDKFLDGTVHYGSWFQHVKGWLRHQEDTFFYITYEEMHMDLRDCIERLCGFISTSLTCEELDNVEQHCSFNTMSQNKMVNCTLISPEIIDHSKGKFMRKGVVGDWKQLFTGPLNILFDRVYQEEMSNCKHSFPLAQD
ncbi:sulfotransferase family cytosolic 2B member 1-like [Rhinatrema bivittatum]|uniref:sulfotransferase family cytosolic 2B member 1-like n=1 Tax=Rhinatrema bivittatum TaxID=194408 RepID=UPI00112967F5|nr:sulfotransferase family cytosolic 2B member 1-like [Rhinatrema bivittatum]